MVNWLVQNWVAVASLAGLLMTLAVLGLGVGNVSATISQSFTGLLNGSSTASVYGNGSVTAKPNIPVAQLATLTTRTSGTAGSLTMTNSSHGVVTGQVVDLYWAGGQCYSAVVGTVAGTTVPIASVGGGAALPTAATAVIVGVRQVSPFEAVGNNVQALLLSMGLVDGYFVFNNGSADVLALYVLAGGIYQWYNGSGVVNPMAGLTPTLVSISQDGISTACGTAQAGAVTN